MIFGRRQRRVIDPARMVPREAARERLNMALTRDRTEVAPGTLDPFKARVVDAAMNYFDLAPGGIDLGLADDPMTGALSLVLYIPVKSFKRGLKEKS